MPRVGDSLKTCAYCKGEISLPRRRRYCGNACANAAELKRQERYRAENR